MLITSSNNSAVATSSTFEMIVFFFRSCPILTGFCFPVTYLFRTVGQVLGVAISSAIVQSVVQKDLVRTITGPEAPYVSGCPSCLEGYYGG